MDRIVKVNEADLDVVVEPGVRRESLNEYLRDTGLFFPIDPGANATLGGMAATRASGTNAVRYGTMRENVLALEVVTATGRIIRTARRARKSAAGYDLTRLFVGSEGTLGVITEVTLRLYGLPEQILSATCTFADASAAVDCVIQLIQLGVPVARVEFLDSAALRAVNKASRLDLAERPSLFFEFHGSNATVAEQIAIAQQVALEHGGSEFKSATNPEARSALWEARHRLALSVASYAVGTRQWWTDVCVPISRLSECIVETQRDIESSGLFAPILGHVGDGNFHVGICAREGDAGEFATAERLHDRLIRRALEHDGTCTGEHGIGRGKLHYLEQELGDAVGLMRDVKCALDPQGIMNPGKVFV
jgi:D-lactate dehydrogenase (cytochrome)